MLEKNFVDTLITTLLLVGMICQMSLVDGVVETDCSVTILKDCKILFGQVKCKNAKVDITPFKNQIAKKFALSNHCTNHIFL